MTALQFLLSYFNAPEFEDSRDETTQTWDSLASVMEAYKQHCTTADVSASLLKDWQMWEDCILSFLRSHEGLRAKFNEHVDEWNTHTKLPPSAYERVEQ